MSEDLEALRRWERSGATWRVLARGPEVLDIALLSCDAGEQVGRLTTAESDVRAHIGDRSASDD